MHYSNFFKTKINLILSAILIILSVFSIIYASLCWRGIAFDGADWFCRMLNDFGDNRWYPNHMIGHRTRIFVTLFEQLPVNLANRWFNINSKYLLGVIFTLPLFLYPFIATIHNILLSFRSKRYDFAVYSTAIYSMFILPSNIYSVVEFFWAVPLFFVLFHYLIADIKYNKFDILCIIFMIVVSYSSCEGIIFYAPLAAVLFYGFYNKNIKKADKITKIIKHFIPINFLLMPFVYVIYYFIYVPDFITDKNRIPDSIRYIIHDIFSLDNLICIIFVLSAVILILFPLRKMLKYIHPHICSCMYGFYFIINSIALFLIIFNKWFLCLSFFSRRIILLLVIPVFMLLPYITDNLKKHYKEINLKLNGILTILLIASIFQTFMDINFSYNFKKTIDLINNKTSAFSEPIVEIKMIPELLSKEYVSYIIINPVETPYYSIAFNYNKKIKNVLVYEKNDISVNDDITQLPYPWSKIKTKNIFWDLTEIAQKTRTSY